jgi:hypothetical protein
MQVLRKEQERASVRIPKAQQLNSTVHQIQELLVLESLAPKVQSQSMEPADFQTQWFRLLLEQRMVELERLVLQKLEL